MTAVFALETIFWISGLFVACMVSLIVSLLLFLKDINLSLNALKLEIASVEPVRTVISLMSAKPRSFI